MLVVFNKLLIVVTGYILLLNIAFGKTEQRWFFALASDDIIDNAADKDTLDNVQRYFAGKDLTIEDSRLTISSDTSCEIVEEDTTPVKYWMSENTVSFYHSFFERYNIKLNENIQILKTLNINSECRYPFSELIKIDNALVMVYKNRAIFYFAASDPRFKAVVESAGENEIACTNNGNELDDVNNDGYIVKCTYPNSDILSIYLQFVNKNKSDNVLQYLKDEIKSGENSKVVISAEFFIEYKWNGDDKLTISIYQPGGETDIIFSSLAGNTSIKTIYLPD
ncbi:hypothetical protein [Intestinirhabdus alba]|jgi:hypothetical protein|uniref:Uncharacterized protein n=1 Tax=Intestinirhabdus alba TaxID=2899544 RepID=A0A6L6IRP7_9ENTR|nr:hypothetical protein [Intestinirhabdus alba]MTH48634.1 hypothetical protein [Intestinirhabdus alba]